VAEQSTFARRMMAQKLMAEKRDDPFSDSRFFAGKMRPSMDDIENPTRLSDMAGPAYGAAATGSLFVPGSGFADVFGGLANPSQPGEMLPSFGANVGRVITLMLAYRRLALLAMCFRLVVRLYRRWLLLVRC
jgi:hypothetical protein